MDVERSVGGGVSRESGRVADGSVEECGEKRSRGAGVSGERSGAISAVGGCGRGRDFGWVGSCLGLGSEGIWALVVGVGFPSRSRWRSVSLPFRAVSLLASAIFSLLIVACLAVLVGDKRGSVFALSGVDISISQTETKVQVAVTYLARELS